MNASSFTAQRVRYVDSSDPAGLQALLLMKRTVEVREQIPISIKNGQRTEAELEDVLETLFKQIENRNCADGGRVDGPENSKCTDIAQIYRHLFAPGSRVRVRPGVFCPLG